MERIDQILLSIKKASLNPGKRTQQEHDVINVVKGSKSYYINKQDLYQILKLYTKRNPKNLIELKYIDLDKVIGSASHREFSLPANKNRFEIKNISVKSHFNQKPLEQKENYLSEFIFEFKNKASLKAGQAKSALTGFKKGFPLKGAITLATCILLLFFVPQIIENFSKEEPTPLAKNINKLKQEKSKTTKIIKKTAKVPSAPKKKQKQLKRIQKQIKKLPKVEKQKLSKKQEKKIETKSLNNREVASSDENKYLNEFNQDDSKDNEIENDDLDVEKKIDLEKDLPTEGAVETYDEAYRDDTAPNNYEEEPYDGDEVMDNYPENDQYLND